MWGQPFPLNRFWTWCRNTPTYVGTTLDDDTHTAAEAEHPHVCGDN